MALMLIALWLGTAGTLRAQTLPVQIPLFSFFPNQLAANAWYTPGQPPRLINGHLDESFGNRERCPTLLMNLKKTHGSFSVAAAEIGHLSTATGLLPLLNAEHIPVSVEIPGFTQSIDGAALAGAEVMGKRLAGDRNLFATVFGIVSPTDRTDPDGKGWFVTRDGSPFIPDEIMFDERIPNLLPGFDPEILAQTEGSWEQRKRLARRGNGSDPSAPPYARRLSALMQDYVKYLDVARVHWGDRMPAIGLHWNVNPGWEWRDEKGLDDIHSGNPDFFNTPANFWGISAQCPQYNSVLYLNDLIDLLTAAGLKPRTVYMDVDWTYNVPYITEVLKRHATALRAKGVQMGINVVEASIGMQDELTCDGKTLTRRTVPDAAPNVLYGNTLIAIMKYLRVSGIYQPGVQIRVGSWSHRPEETAARVDEKNPGSLAHTANAIADVL